MAYAGLPPAIFTNNLTNVQLIDDISGSFNGSTQTFALTSNSAPFHAVSARSLLVTLGGITQKPQVDYTVDGANITFTTPPVSGLTFAARNIYGLNYLNNVNDGVITPAKLSTGAPTWNTGGTVTVSGDLNVTGSFNSGTQGLFWGDNEPANFGNDNDLRIYHDGNDSWIMDRGTGSLYLEGNNQVTIRSHGSGDTMFRANSDGSVELYYDNSKKFETTSGGIFVSGTARVPNATAFTSSDSGGTERWLMYMSGGVSPSSGNKLIIGNPLNDDVILFTNNTERLRITSGGNIQLNGGILYGDDTALPSFTIQNTSGNSNHAKIILGEVTASDNGGITFYTAGSSTSTKRLVIKGTNGNVGIGADNPPYKLRVVPTVPTAGFDGIDLYDNSVSAIGIYKTGSTYSFGTVGANEAWLYSNSGDLNITSDGSGVIKFQGDNGAERVRITSTGNVGIGTTNPDFKLHVNGSSIGLGTNGGSFNQRILNGGTGNYTIEMDTTERIRITGTGGHLLPGADATQDLGSPTKRWANIYSADLQLSNEGSPTGNDIDGTWGAYTIQEGEEALYLINRRSGKKFKFVLEEVK